jgi:hypothetical protein
MSSRHSKSCAFHKPRERDWLALSIVAPILLYAAAILLLPMSAPVREAAARRFHLAGWPFAAWALFQPLPSMYNFENRWDVTFTTSARTAPAEDCAKTFHSFVNHHVFNRVLLYRAPLERCGLPATVRFQSTYRGTTVETRYRLTRGPDAHGFIVTHDPE